MTKIPTSADALEAFRLAPGVHLIGLMERGVTIYNQQVRAHNFAWALHHAREKEIDKPRRIAIVGGGIAGLTTAVCILNKFPISTTAVLFERRLDLCPIQQGADHRWIHPHIYDWPDEGSDRPSTGLPLMRWEAGRASDVVGRILEQFRVAHHKYTERIEVIVGAEHVKLSVPAKRVEWTGKRTRQIDGFYSVNYGQGNAEVFDEIVLAVGFGLEIAPDDRVNTSYWRNEQVSQPILGSSANRILVSGYGDGALTDLFRLTIERFKQESILREIFADAAAQKAAEVTLRKIKEAKKPAPDLFAAFEQQFGGAVDMSKRLSHRLRKDTRVYLHLGGPNGKNTSIVDAFGGASSFLNRFMLFLLFRCGAFVPVFGKLEKNIVALNIDASNVLCRHGTSTQQDFAQILMGSEADIKRQMDLLDQIRSDQRQSPQPWFSPGFFQPDSWR